MTEMPSIGKSETRLQFAGGPTVVNAGRGVVTHSVILTNISATGICVLLADDQVFRPFRVVRLEDGASMELPNDEIETNAPVMLGLKYIVPGGTYIVAGKSAFAQLTNVRNSDGSMGQRLSQPNEFYTVRGDFLAMECSESEDGNMYDFNTHKRKTFSIDTPPSQPFKFVH